MREISLLIILFLMMGVLSAQVLAVDAGGELKIKFSSQLQQDGDFDKIRLVDQLNLNLYLPRFKNNEIRYAFTVTKPVQGLMTDEEVSYFTKKLYLKHRFEDFHLTIGRQPVSWSFGSLLNPADYTIGAVVLNEEQISKYYTDAIEAYIPINWNSSISLVGSFSAGFSRSSDKTKFGIRGRMGIKGYDFTLNYVREPEVIAGKRDIVAGFPINSLIAKNRIGLTAKGDIGHLGAYGSLVYNYDDQLKNTLKYLVGTDYSYMVNYDTRVSLQLEYLRIELNNSLSNDDSSDILTGSLSYPLNNFSALRLTAMTALDDNSLVLSPGYQNTLPGNIDINLEASIFVNKGDGLLAAGETTATTTVTFIYPF